MIVLQLQLTIAPSDHSAPDAAMPAKYLFHYATALLMTAVLSLLLVGCAAWTNPVAGGISAYELPPDLVAVPKESKQRLPLTYLRQKPPQVYRLAAGDVLGIYIEGVLGDVDVVPPVNVVESTGQAPSLGYPVPVREDGTLPLPQIKPLSVAGKTVEEVEQEIIRAYTTGKEPILKPGKERVIVSLVRPRQIRVLVLRQDSPDGAIELPRPGVIRSSREFRGGAESLIRGTSSGTGTIVDLPAYENDVLNALARTGGLPGLDADDEIIIQRGYPLDRFAAPCGTEMSQGQPFYVAGEQVVIPEDGGVAPLPRQIIRIPLRLWPGEPLPFSHDDIILRTGDVVVINAREKAVYYTGGLLPTGEYPLPRDYDLTVVEAVSQIGGPIVNGGINANNLSGALVAPGVGSPSPRLLTVIRRAPDGRRLPINVDLNCALTDPNINLVVKPGDVLILQETRQQALARYFGQFFNFTIFAEIFSQGRSFGTVSTSALPP
jgi:hypothetical protein